MHEKEDAFLSGHKAAGVIYEGLILAAHSMATYRHLVVVQDVSFLLVNSSTAVTVRILTLCKHTVVEEVLTYLDKNSSTTV